MLLAFLTSFAASSLAPSVSYRDMHAFLHMYDSTPKLLLLAEDGDGKARGQKEESDTVETEGAKSSVPSWFTSAAMNFKDGRKKSVSFAYVSAEDSAKVSARFGVSEIGLGGIVIGVVVDGKGGGTFAVLEGTLRTGGGHAVRAVKAFAQSLLDVGASKLLPNFPPPDVPRKQAATKLIELTHENLHQCFGDNAPLCILALLPDGATECPSTVAELARRHRNDPVQFGWVKAAQQAEFVAAFGVSTEQLPQLLAVRPGKRSRYALAEGELQSSAMGAFVDRILGGDMSFTRLKELPDLEPAYLLFPEGGDRADDESITDEGVDKMEL